MKQTLYTYVVVDVSGQEQWVALNEKEAIELYKKLERDLNEQ